MKLRQIALSGFLLLVLTIGWLTAPTLSRLFEQRTNAASIRAALIAGNIAHQISNALQIGIPLEQLEGVGDLFSQHGKRNAVILSITFVDAAGKALHRYENAEASGALAPASIGMTAADVHDTTQLRGRVEIRFTVGHNLDLLGEIAALILVISTLGGVISTLFLRHSAESGPLARDRATTRLCEAIRTGHFSVRLDDLPACSFDRRPHELARRIRSLKESHARLSRMLTSLTATEPTPEGRARLQSLRISSEAGLPFIEAPPQHFFALDSERHRQSPILLLTAALAALRFPLISSSGETASGGLALAWLLLGGGLLALRCLNFDRRWQRLAPFAFLAIALLALIPLPFFVRLVASSLLGALILATRCRESRNDLHSVLIGETLGLLSGALLSHLSAGAPALFSVVATLLGTTICRQPSASGRIDPPHASTVRQALGVNVLAVIMAGALLAQSVSLLHAATYISTLSLTAMLIALSTLCRPSRDEMTKSSFGIGQFWIGLAVGALLPLAAPTLGIPSSGGLGAIAACGVVLIAWVVFSKRWA